METGLEEKEHMKKSASPDTLSNHNQIKDGRGALPVPQGGDEPVRVGHSFDLGVLSEARLR